MQLLLQNTLVCPASGGFPLKIVATHTTSLELSASEQLANSELLRRILPRVNWDAMVAAAHDLGLEDVPAEPRDYDQVDDGTLLKLADILMQVQVVEGELLSPCGTHRYQIHDGIPNMVVDLSTKNIPVGSRGSVYVVSSPTAAESTAKGAPLPVHRLYRRREQKEICVMHGNPLPGSVQQRQEAARLSDPIYALIEAWQTNSIGCVELLGGILLILRHDRRHGGR